MPGLKEIAQAANVSIRTVSRVIKGNGYVSESARQAVEKVIAELGYRPNLAARSLRTNRSYEIVVLGWSFDELHLPKLAAIEQTMRQADYSVSVYFEDSTKKGQPEKILSDLEARKPAGIIMLRMSPMNCHWWAEKFNRMSLPFVFMDPVEKGPDLAGVYIDRAKGVYHSVQYLAKQGRKRIAYFGSDDKSRLDGYRQAIDELGMERVEVLFRKANQTSETVTKNAEHLLSLDPLPDAVQTYSDVVAMFLLANLHDNGIAVPKEMAVVGFDNRHVAELAWPALSTVAQPNTQAGRAAAEILLERINGSPEPPEGWSRVLQTELVVRKSS